MTKTDEYGYTYDASMGRCTTRLNGRTIVFEASGYSIVMKETPHLIAGEEIRTGGISFAYADENIEGTNYPAPVSDSEWKYPEEFKWLVRGAHDCLMSHYEEDGTHIVL